jgi:hypothetical protein
MFINRRTTIAIALTTSVALILPSPPAEAQLIPYWRILPMVIRSKQFKPVRERIGRQIVRARRNGKIRLPLLKNLRGTELILRSVRSGDRSQT